MIRVFIFALAAAALASSQVPVVDPGTVLDPSRVVQHAVTVGSFHKPLPEQYIWTADDAAVATGANQLSQLKLDTYKVEPHDFRKAFELKTKPDVATLYIAGPRRAIVWINGAKVAEMQYAGGHHMGFGTMSADVGSALRTGSNVIAIEAVRGGGSHHHTNALKTSWLNSGEVLAVKLVAAAQGEEAPELALSDPSWKSTVGAKDGWQQPEFDDATWKRVSSLGAIESSPDFFQWNADAGMYAWPGYLGEASYMANFRMLPVKTTATRGQLLLDFGRELNGRLLVQTGMKPTRVTIRMGESMGELLNAPYLGDIALEAAADRKATGPKTGFRYARVDFDPAADAPTVLAEGIYYPSPQIGTFESSDPLVNRIFETAVYTAHLSMQDSILDGIKRDRGRWIGDDEVINRVALDVYGNVPIIKEGIEDAIGPEPVTEAVGGLPGYSAWWVVAEYEYITRTGDLDQLRAVKTRMLQLLALMEKDLDARKVYAGKGKPFVDWSKSFSTDTPEARRAVHYEYMRAFLSASQLLRLLDGKSESKRYVDLAIAMGEASIRYLEDAKAGVGDRWQTNIAASLTPLPQDHPWPDVWLTADVLGRVVQGRKPTDVITPYYGSYMLEALSGTPLISRDGNTMALQWLKSYWGGMLENGATSFWEAWDPSWAGDDPHAKVEADDKVGYNASLSHGWSSGPAAWLLENVLGVTSGADHCDIQPGLAGLQWVKGTIASSKGPIRVEVSDKRVLVTLPAGTDCHLRIRGTGWSGDPVKVEDYTLPATSEAHLAGGRSYEFTRK